MSDIEEKIIKWGFEKGILGVAGTATPVTQAAKMIEEAAETMMAVVKSDHGSILSKSEKDEIFDGIGDVYVTIVLLAHMHGISVETCAELAHQVISKRTGKMVSGVFVKD